MEGVQTNKKETGFFFNPTHPHIHERTFLVVIYAENDDYGRDYSIVFQGYHWEFQTMGANSYLTSRPLDENVM